MIIIHDSIFETCISSRRKCRRSREEASARVRTSVILICESHCEPWSFHIETGASVIQPKRRSTSHREIMVLLSLTYFTYNLSDMSLFSNEPDRPERCRTRSATLARFATKIGSRDTGRCLACRVPSSSLRTWLVRLCTSSCA